MSFVFAEKTNSSNGTILKNTIRNVIPSVVTISTDTSVGTGFILSKDGYILTNHHVVSGRKDINVILSDGTEFKASVAGNDELNDISLLKIKTTTDLKPVEIESNFELGENVIVIGNLHNLGISVSTGIVSGLNRKIGKFAFNFIQMNASISRGNSGGPLFNENGKVIGIVAATHVIEDRISFAIPMVEILPILDELKEYGSIERGSIGLKTHRIDPKIQSIIGVKNGVIVTDVFKNGPADKSGILVGDVIVSSENKIISNPIDLEHIISSFAINSKIPLTTYRNGHLKNIYIKSTKDADYSDASFLAKAIRIFDMFVLPVDKEVRDSFSLGNDLKGGYVLHVEKGGIADRNGIKQGSVVLSINQNVIIDEDSILNAINKIENEKNVFLIIKGLNKIILLEQ
ncbi:MAG: trypsin-like peptidase domain-containing protein [Rickettsiales bacterium]|jgi:serine protease Do|nr:trypsin-like peptidase domain-containing protein [Rickettsiales bacterium]